MVSETEAVCLRQVDATTSLTIALIADIHGNLAALDAVLDALGPEQPGRFVCLGDVAATGPQPREVLRRLHGLGCPVVMGNADAELLDVAPPGPETDDDSRRIADIARWCAAQLDDAAGRSWPRFNRRWRSRLRKRGACFAATARRMVNVDFRRVSYDRDATVRTMT